MTFFDCNYKCTTRYIKFYNNEEFLILLFNDKSNFVFYKVGNKKIKKINFNHNNKILKNFFDKNDIRLEYDYYNGITELGINQTFDIIQTFDKLIYFSLYNILISNKWNNYERFFNRIQEFIKFNRFDYIKLLYDNKIRIDIESIFRTQKFYIKNLNIPLIKNSNMELLKKLDFINNIFNILDILETNKEDLIQLNNILKYDEEYMRLKNDISDEQEKSTLYNLILLKKITNKSYKEIIDYLIYLKENENYNLLWEIGRYYYSDSYSIINFNINLKINDEDFLKLTDKRNYIRDNNFNISFYDLIAYNILIKTDILKEYNFEMFSTNLITNYMKVLKIYYDELQNRYIKESKRYMEETTIRDYNFVIEEYDLNKNKICDHNLNDLKLIEYSKDIIENKFLFSDLDYFNIDISKIKFYEIQSTYKKYIFIALEEFKLVIDLNSYFHNSIRNKYLKYNNENFLIINNKTKFNSMIDNDNLFNL